MVCHAGSCVEFRQSSRVGSSLLQVRWVFSCCFWCAVYFSLAYLWVFRGFFFPPTFYHILGTLGIQIYTKSKAFFLSSSDRFQVIIFAWKALFRTKIHTELWKADILKRDHIKILNFWFPLHHSDQNQTSFKIILSPAEPAFCLMSLTW